MARSMSLSVVIFGAFCAHSWIQGRHERIEMAWSWVLPRRLEKGFIIGMGVGTAWFGRHGEQYQLAGFGVRRGTDGPLWYQDS